MTVVLYSIYNGNMYSINIYTVNNNTHAILIIPLDLYGWYLNKYKIADKISEH